MTNTDQIVAMALFGLHNRVAGRWNGSTLALAYEHVHRNYTLYGAILLTINLIHC